MLPHRHPTLVAAALALATGVSSPGLAADRVDARYEVFGFAGMHVLTNRTSLEETPNSYSIAVNLGSRGVASAFVDLRIHSEVYGKISSEAARPEAYRSNVWRNGDDHDYGVRYLGDGNVVNAVVLPPPEGSYLDGVPLRGTVDQLSAYYLLERQLARRGSCNLTVPVFDGSELYRLRFWDVKEETLTPDGHQNFAGPTQLCEVARELIVANPNKNMSTYNRGRMWYARLLRGARVVPVRMEYDTPFGAVVGYLAELTGYGVHLKYMETQ